jgi:hypothetical protein
MARPLVVMGFAEALSAPEAAWSLADRGYRVAAFGRRGRRAAVRHSRHVEYHEIAAPEAGLEQSAEELHGLLGRLGAGTLFPLEDTAVLLCGMAAKRNPSWALAGPVGACEQLALNKEMQTQQARAAGFAVPETWMARSREELLRIGREQAFPLILRPSDCVLIAGGRVQKGSNWICSGMAELEQAAEKWNARYPLMVQPFVTGTGEGLFGLALADGVQAWSAHRRLRMMNPHGSGSSACVSQAPDPEARRAAEHFLAATGWRGLFMIELLRDLAGKLWFVEMNGRPWGSMALSRKQGLEYPVWQVRLANGQAPFATTPPQARAGVVCRNVGRELMHLLFVLRGPKSGALAQWPSVGATLAALLRFGKGDGLYNWRPDDQKVFWADCYNTLHGNLIKARR